MRFKPTPEQLENGFVITVATVFVIAGADILYEYPVIATAFLLMGAMLVFVKKILSKL